METKIVSSWKLLQTNAMTRIKDRTQRIKEGFQDKDRMLSHSLMTKAHLASANKSKANRK